MSPYTLVQYGNINLTSPNIVVNSASSDRGVEYQNQRLNNTREAGSTLVNSTVGEKEIVLSGYMKANNGECLTEIYNHLSLSLTEIQRDLRFIRRWSPLISSSDNKSWTAINDGVVGEYTTENAWFSGAREFSADVSLSGENSAGIFTTGGDGADISDYVGIGNFEVQVYIPDSTYISSITFRVGSDSSNYLSTTLTEQFDGTAISDGWNIFSNRWDLMTQTGSVDASSMGTYIYVLVNYTSSQADLNGFKFGGCLWQDDRVTRNYKSIRNSLELEEEHYNVSFSNFNLDMLAIDGIAKSTTEEVAINKTLSTNGENTEINFEGTYEPKPVIQITLNTITNLDSIEIENETTGTSVTIDETWVSGDIIKINTENKEITQNNIPIEYSNVLPLFVVGKNNIKINLTSTASASISQTTYNVDLKGEV